MACFSFLFGIFLVRYMALVWVICLGWSWSLAFGFSRLVFFGFGFFFPALFGFGFFVFRHDASGPDPRRRATQTSPHRSIAMISDDMKGEDLGLRI